MGNWIRRFSDQIIAATSGLLSLCVYTATLAPSVLMADAGEFQFAAPLAAIAHPTGYPLYLILGWLWSQIYPFGTPAYKMNLLSAVFASAAVSLMYLVLLRFIRLAGFLRHPGLHRGIALLAALLLAFSPTFWSQAVIAEVYALNALLTAGLLYALLTWLQDGKDWKGLIPTAAFFGLGLAHHRTIILWLPAIILTIWLAEAGSRPKRLAWKHLAWLLVPALLPLLVYLYVPIRAPATPYLEIPLRSDAPLRLYTPSLAGFLNYVLGRSFEGAIRFQLLTPARLEMAAGFLDQQFSPAGIILGLVGLAWLVWERRWLLLALTAGAVLPLIGFNCVYDIGDIAVFFIPVYQLWAIWMGLGITWLCRQAGDLVVRLGTRSARNGLLRFGRFSMGSHHFAGWVVLTITFALPIYLFIQTLPHADRHNDWDAWIYWKRILAEPLPAGAVLVSNDRDEIMPLWYFQYIESARPDLIGLFPQIMMNDHAWEDIGLVIDQALASGRPVYLIKPMPGMEVKYRLASAGAEMVKVEGYAAESAPQRPADAPIGDVIRLVGYDHSPYSVVPGQDLTVTLYWEPLARMKANYSSFVQLLDQAGNRVAGSDHLPGGDYYPTRLWKPGERLADTHHFTVPADLPPGPYQLYAGLYLYPSIERLGDARLGFVGVKTTVESIPRIMPHPLQVRFGDVILLWGYEYRKEGQSILLTLEWQALQEMAINYTTFIHLVDSAGTIVSQADSQPRGGSYPTSIWDKGEVVIDAYRLPIELDTPAGEYSLIMGLYRLETMQRLPAFDEHGNPLGDAVLLAKITWP
ncbi:MAG: glycosyltransferase family 117 protein [Anaerolineae bacterium]